MEELAQQLEEARKKIGKATVLLADAIDMLNKVNKVVWKGIYINGGKRKKKP